MNRAQYLETRNISVAVIDTLFDENGCESSSLTAGGGGMHMNLATHNADRDSNQLIITRVRFKCNCAQFGGGLYFYSDHDRNYSNKHLSIFTLEECFFEGNKAHTGSAVHITPNVFQRLSSGILLTPTFKNCIFFNNTVMMNVKAANHTQTTLALKGHKRATLPCIGQ